MRTQPLAERPSKVHITDLGRPLPPGSSLAAFLESLPKQLGAPAFLRARDHLARAAARRRPIVTAIGGHVIKVGCSPYLIEWIERGIVTAVAMHGAPAIHDFELALAGKTSEDVAAQLVEGQFGMSKETADGFAAAALGGVRRGFGWSLGRMIERGRFKHRGASVLAACYRARIPCTIHVAVGADIVHMHPGLDGAALGASTLRDFRTLCAVVATMKNGVWMNIGSAVLLPEVFLKAVAVARNLRKDLRGLVTINMDMEAHYRTSKNVLARPVVEGIDLRGHHELMVPLLHAAVQEKLRAGPRNLVKRGRGDVP